MKNTVRQIGFAILIMAIALSTLHLTGCEDDSPNIDTALNGTWFESEKGMELKLNNGSFESTGMAKGTYTASGGKCTFTITHLNGANWGFDSEWCSKTELKTKYKQEGMSDAQANAYLNQYFAIITGTYSVSGNTLTMKYDSGMFDGETFNLTKR